MHTFVITELETYLVLSTQLNAAIHCLSFSTTPCCHGVKIDEIRTKCFLADLLKVLETFHTQ